MRLMSTPNSTRWVLQDRLMQPQATSTTLKLAVSGTVSCQVRSSLQLDKCRLARLHLDKLRRSILQRAKKAWSQHELSKRKSSSEKRSLAKSSQAKTEIHRNHSNLFLQSKSSQNLASTLTAQGPAKSNLSIQRLRIWHLTKKTTSRGTRPNRSLMSRRQRLSQFLSMKQFRNQSLQRKQLHRRRSSRRSAKAVGLSARDPSRRSKCRQRRREKGRRALQSSAVLLIW